MCLPCGALFCSQYYICYLKWVHAYMYVYTSYTELWSVCILCASIVTQIDTPFFVEIIEL